MLAAADSSVCTALSDCLSNHVIAGSRLPHSRHAGSAILQQEDRQSQISLQRGGQAQADTVICAAIVSILEPMSQPAAGEKAAETVRARSASPSCKDATERSNRPFRSPLLTDGGQILMAGANFQARVPDAAQETLQQSTSGRVCATYANLAPQIEARTARACVC